ncbi:MAG: hypothetical protein Q9175_006954 [Cornicularia normoerica]
MAMSKVDKWAAMAAERQAATVVSTFNDPNEVGPSAAPNLTGVTASTVGTPGHSDAPVVNKRAVTPITKSTPRRPFVTPTACDDSVKLAPKQQQPRSRKPKGAVRQPKHDEGTAHLFNNAGVLMPSIPGIDSVTERLFDQGEIMSLRPSRSHDSYYPDGEPHPHSFLLDHSDGKKRIRLDKS